MQTSHHLVVETCTHVGILSNWQTAVVVVGYDEVVIRHGCGVSLVTKFKAFPVGLVGTNSPVKARIQFSTRGLLSLEEVIQPGRSGKVCPTTKSAGTEVTLDSRTLCGISTGINRCPLVVSTLRAIVQELNFIDALVVVLV